MIFFKKKKNKVEPIHKRWKIARNCLDLILECAKSEYPSEFGGFLRVDADEKDTITELVLLPGTISGESHAIFSMNMLPIDSAIIGTVHSHPSYSASPSGADLQLFQKHGKIHIIAAKPFDEFSWKAYDYMGRRIDVDVI
jgi:proteasome lid subunit RPN8/RPN11